MTWLAVSIFLWDRPRSQLVLKKSQPSPLEIGKLSRHRSCKKGFVQVRLGLPWRKAVRLPFQFGGNSRLTVRVPIRFGGNLTPPGCHLDYSPALAAAPGSIFRRAMTTDSRKRRSLDFMAIS